MKRIPKAELSELREQPRSVRASELGEATYTASPESLWAQLRALQAAMPELMERALARLLDEELALKPVHVRALVTELSARARESHGPFVLAVHPGDLPLLDGLLSDVEVEPDPGLRRGGCVLRSSTVELDGRVETRLARVLEALRG